MRIFATNRVNSQSNTGAANFRVPRMSNPDCSTATEKQDELSKIDEILKDMTNNVEEGKTLHNQPSATCESIILFSCTSVKAYSNLNPPCAHLLT